MLKQLVKRLRVSIVVLLTLLVCGARNIQAQDDYLVGAYYYPWYHENSWFSRGLRVATDSLLHYEDYYFHFVSQQFNLFLNRDTLFGEAQFYVNGMQNLGWRQDSVILYIGQGDEYFDTVCNSQNSIFVDSISSDLMGTYKALLDSLDSLFLPWCVNQLDSNLKTRAQIIDTMLRRPERQKWLRKTKTVDKNEFCGIMR